jgi:protein SCO1/2
LIASNLNTALRQLGTARTGVRVLAVSVDPSGDTQAAVRAFVRQHRLLPTFRYLIGSPARLRRVWGDYRIAVETSSLSSFSAHSAAVYLIDAAGRERVLYSAHFQPRDVVHDIHLLMEE